MNYLTIAILCFFCTILFIIIDSNQKSKKIFEKKIQSLEKIIVELSRNLEMQSQKLKLSEDLKTNMRQSNHSLSTKIVDLNNEMFAEIFQKKNL
jgi:gas vesicle protein